MKKALYIVLLVIEALSLIFPLYFILYLDGILVGALALVIIAAVYAFLGIRAFKQNKAGDEAGFKKSKIIVALVCPVIWVAFIAYFFYVCAALGVI